MFQNFLSIFFWAISNDGLNFTTSYTEFSVSIYSVQFLSNMFNILFIKVQFSNFIISQISLISELISNFQLFPVFDSTLFMCSLSQGNKYFSC